MERHDPSTGLLFEPGYLVLGKGERQRAVKKARHLLRRKTEVFCTELGKRTAGAEFRQRQRGRDSTRDYEMKTWREMLQQKSHRCVDCQIGDNFILIEYQDGSARRSKREILSGNAEGVQQRRQKCLGRGQGRHL